MMKLRFSIPLTSRYFPVATSTSPTPSFSAATWWRTCGAGWGIKTILFLKFTQIHCNLFLILLL